MKGVCAVAAVFVLGLGFSITLTGATKVWAEDRDVLGIFFDDQGISTMTQTTEPWEVVNAWLVLKGMSAGITGFGGPRANFPPD